MRTCETCKHWTPCDAEWFGHKVKRKWMVVGKCELLSKKVGWRVIVPCGHTCKFWEKKESKGLWDYAEVDRDNSNKREMGSSDRRRYNVRTDTVGEKVKRFRQNRMASR